MGVLMVLVVAGLAAGLPGCAPGAAVLSPLSFELVPDGSGLVRVDPPGIGTGAAVFRARLRVLNPNPIGVRLASLDGSLYLGGQRAADATFRGGVDLPAGGTSALTLDVAVPLATAPQLIGTLAGVVAGTPTEVRVDAQVGVNAFGAVQRFPTVTLVQATVTSPLALVAPTLDFDPSATELRIVSLSRVELTIGATLGNPAPIGYRASAPGLTLLVAGSRAGDLALEPLAVPAGGSTPLRLTFAFDPLALGAAVAAQVQAAAAGVGNVSVALRGGWRLDAGALGSRDVAVGELLSAALR